jgi:hypothetical protein
MLTSREQNARQNRKIKLGSKSFEIVARLKYLRTTLTNKNCLHEEIMGRFSVVWLHMQPHHQTNHNDVF